MADPEMEGHPSVGPEYPSPQKAGSDYVQPLGKLQRNLNIKHQGAGSEDYGKFGSAWMKEGKLK